MTARDTHETRLRSWPLLSTFPTTNGRIVLSMWLAAAVVLTHLACVVVATIRGDLTNVWTPGIEILGFLCAWGGLDVLQFTGKRFSDSDYIAAKKGNGNGHAGGSDASGQ